MIQNNAKQRYCIYVLCAIPILWLSLLFAPILTEGFPHFYMHIGEVLDHPFHITLCQTSLESVLIGLVIYGLILGVMETSGKNYRRNEEYGSARWGSAAQINGKYAASHPLKNKQLTQNVAISLDCRKHMRNLNVLVCGGSGSGKTRFYAKPNIMNANTSFVVLDPKG